MSDHPHFHNPDRYYKMMAGMARSWGGDFLHQPINWIKGIAHGDRLDMVRAYSGMLIRKEYGRDDE